MLITYMRGPARGRLHGEFQPGLKFEIEKKSERLPSWFVENTITEHAHAHFSARAEILIRCHEVFLNFSPGLKVSPCNRKRLLKRFVQEAEVKS